MERIISCLSATGFKLSLFLFLSIAKLSSGQIENVIVETYYVSDANDATDTTGGGLAQGSITYRIFVDLKPNCKVKEINGDVYHPLRISSTDIFFNNKADGKSFGKDFNKNRFLENTVALDTWLTIGQVSQYGTKTYFGVPKDKDRDGSFIGGTNNDGGSAAIPEGLLASTNSSAGIPLTQKDGIDTMIAPATTWANVGIVDFLSQTDSTIFGSLITGNSFYSENVQLISSEGAFGVDRNENIVLLAQLTTQGEISFELNLLIEESDGVNSQLVRYVANADTLLEGEKLSPYLKYPFLCGCKDPDYTEYKDIYACNIQDSCKTRVVLGCMDSLACNFNPNANFSVPSLCCYPGLCSDRDIKVACPEYDITQNQLFIFPNPTSGLSSIRYFSTRKGDLFYSVKNLVGTEIAAPQKLAVEEGWNTWPLDFSSLDNGAYFLVFFQGSRQTQKVFFLNK